MLSPAPRSGALACLLDVSVHLDLDDLLPAPEDARVFAEPAVLLLVDVQLTGDNGRTATSATVNAAKLAADSRSNFFAYARREK